MRAIPENIDWHESIGIAQILPKLNSYYMDYYLALPIFFMMVFLTQLSQNNNNKQSLPRLHREKDWKKKTIQCCFEVTLLHFWWRFMEKTSVIRSFFCCYWQRALPANNSRLSGHNQGSRPIKSRHFINTLLAR